VAAGSLRGKLPESHLSVLSQGVGLREHRDDCPQPASIIVTQRAFPRWACRKTLEGVKIY